MIRWTSPTPSSAQQDFKIGSIRLCMFVLSDLHLAHLRLTAFERMLYTGHGACGRVDVLLIVRDEFAYPKRSARTGVAAYGGFTEFLGN